MSSAETAPTETAPAETAPGKTSPVRAILGKSRGISRAVMMEHTLFSLPLAVSAFMLESGGRPGWWKVFWITAAVFGARNAANALNRIIDREIDRANPRTADRDLPAGRVSAQTIWAFTLFCGALLLVSAFMLNPLCLALVPVAAVLIGGYSFTKRFTALCHYWLGITCAAATMGSFLALGGRFELRYFPLTIAAALWVAGFDIIYALQDLEHDRASGLHSMPALLGRRGALALAALTHLGTVFFFTLNFFFFSLRLWYLAGVALAGGILVLEHALAWKGSGPARDGGERKHAGNERARDGGSPLIPFAAYRLNQILSPLFILFVLLDIYLPGGMYGS